MIDRYPLTREQQGLWVEWKLSQQTVSYNTCVQVRLAGQMDVERFRAAISDVVEFFDLLHAHCIEEQGQVYLTYSDAPFELEFIDVSDQESHETASAREQANRLLDAKREANIDLTRFPLISAALIRSAPEVFYFTGVVPHIISDGVSAIYVLQAISAAYNGGRAALHDAFASTKKDWTDYLTLRHARSDAAASKAAVNHWQNVLAGARHLTDIGVAYRGAGDIRGRREYFEIDAATAGRMGKLAFRNRTSLFSVLSAIFATFLYRYGSQDDLVIGYPVNLRPAGYRHAFGFFVNIVPLRVDLSGDPSFETLVRRIGQRRKADKPHHHLPSLDIVRAKRDIEPEFDGRMSNVSMAQTVSRLHALELDGVVCEPLDNEFISVRDDLSLMYEVTDTHIGLWIEYRESAFSDSMIQQMLHHMRSIIREVDANPELQIQSIPMMDTQETLRLTSGFNPPSVGYRKLHLAEWFEAQVRQGPDRIALVMGEEQMTYQELDQSANALAIYLATQFDCTAAPIAILLDRSFLQFVAILAVVKAGAAYLPLDTAYPAARIDAILDSSQASCILTTGEQVGSLSVPASDRVVELNRVSLNTARTDTAKQSFRGDNAPAYVIYTSGSSGQPKGVQVSHHALSARLDWLLESFALKPGETVLQNTHYTFDVSVAEIFWPLASGATLVLVEPEKHRDPKHINSLIRRHKIAAACFVPSALSTAINASGDGAWTSVRHLLCAGEPLPRDLIARFYRVCSSGLLHNVYGPTEATVYASCKTCSVHDETVTIGRPISHTSLYVLDERLAVQPTGVAGQLYIGGEGLADGYYGRPDMTDDRFLPNPFGTGRLYRTGDLARLNEDLEIEFLGRNDSQVKLRGYRIELQEVAHSLLQMPGVAEAVVVLDGEHSKSARTQLIAYYTGAETRLALLRSHLEGLLPGYMIPQRFVRLDAIPRLASDKIDLRSLPATGPIQPSITTPIQPESASEKALCAIWSNVLGVPLEEVGCNSNFFELGGDSLMAIQIISAAEAKGIFIDVQDALQHPTIRGALAQARQTRGYDIDQSPVVGVFPLLPRHRKFFADGFVTPHHWNRCFLLELPRELDPTTIETSLSELMKHHDGLRLGFERDADGRVYARNHGPDTGLRLDRFDVAHLAPDEQELYMIDVLQKANASLRLSRPPLFRAAYFLLGKDRPKLGLVSHHLLLDMRSCRILFEDLLTACQQLQHGVPIALPPKTTSVKEWSERLSALAQQHAFSEEVDFWRTQLRTRRSPLPFDFNASGDDVTEADQSRALLTFDKLETNALTRSLRTTSNAGADEIVLAGFAEAFRAWSRADNLVFNICGVGRERVFEGVSLDRTVGEINTVFPLALPLSDGDLLDVVKRTFAAIPAKGLHYPMLRYLLENSDISQLREPDVFFNYVSRIDPSLSGICDARLLKLHEGVYTSAPENQACYKLYVEASIVAGCLNVTLDYSRKLFDVTNINGLLALFRAALDRQITSFTSQTTLDTEQQTVSSGESG